MLNGIAAIAILSICAGPLPADLVPADELGIVRIRAVTSDYGAIAYSTGTHLGNGWILTCGHCSDSTAHYGRVEVQILSADTWRATRRVRGIVVYSDAEADLGLIRLESGHGLQTAYQLAPRGFPIATGDRVIAYEWEPGDSGETLTSRVGYITSVNRYLGPENIETTGRPQGGSSGGPLVSARDGLIIGVTRGAFIDEDRGLFTATEEIHHAIDQLQHGSAVSAR